jgi:hypothetical protein
MLHFIPGSLDIDELLDGAPTSGIRPFKKDHLIHILHLILSIPATNKNLELVNGYVPLQSAILQKKIRNYRAYLDYLLDNGIIETDHWYIKGQKSIGYKLKSRYCGNVAIVRIADQGLIKAIKRDAEIPVSVQRKYKHLLKWYNSALKINRALAMDYINADFERKRANPSLCDYDHRRQAYKRPLQQYTSSFINIERIAAVDFSLSVDNNVHRLHSPLSNIKSELRNYLTYNDLELVSIDVRNCQPYLSTVVLKSSFWEVRYPSHTGLTIDDCSMKVNEVFSSSSLTSFIRLCKAMERCSSSDLQRYQEEVRNGTFYECMQKELASQLDIDHLDRKEVKAAIFQLLFTDNRFIGQEEAKPKQMFKKSFPTVYELLSLIKKGDKTKLPKLLQRIESHLILSVITKRIARERVALPLFTIHDSIITTTGNEGFIQEILLKEMERAIGFPPQLSIEYWRPGNIKSEGLNIFLDKSIAA